jgi:hypothetical protein
MKNYTSQEEGVWKENQALKLTEEQLSVIEGEDSVEKTELIASVRDNSFVNVEDVTELVALYNAHKPVLKEGDLYAFINMNVSGSNGILNCRVNGEHKQIRF